jgi:hypothetical protein
MTSYQWRWIGQLAVTGSSFCATDVSSVVGSVDISTRRMLSARGDRAQAPRPVCSRDYRLYQQ